MRCITCGEYFPGDSDFCPFCGRRITQPVHEYRNVSTIYPTKALTQIQQPEQPKNKERDLLIRLLAALLVVALCVNVYQGYIYKKNRETVAGLDSLIVRLQNNAKDDDKTIADLESELKESTASLKRLKDNDKTYKKLLSALKKQNIGYATANFRLDKGIIIVDKDDTSNTLMLTANWNDGGTVTTSYDTDFYGDGKSGPAAEIDYKKNEWSESVELEIDPKYKGIAVVEFTSTASSHTLRAIIVVQ